MRQGNNLTGRVRYDYKGREALWVSWGIPCGVHGVVWLAMSSSGGAHSKTIGVCDGRSGCALYHCHHYPHVLTWMVTKCW